MISVNQRVLEARVTVAGKTVGEIGPGLLALVAVERGDQPANAARMVELKAEKPDEKKSYCENCLMIF